MRSGRASSLSRNSGSGRRAAGDPWPLSADFVWSLVCLQLFVRLKTDGETEDSRPDPRQSEFANHTQPDASTRRRPRCSTRSSIPRRSRLGGDVKRSLCVPRPLGSYAVEWEPTEWQDDDLGRLGGAFRGTVIEFKPGREFFLADAYWLPPDGDPIGPMALEADVHAARHQHGAFTSASPDGKTALAGRATTSSSRPRSRSHSRK